MNINGLIAIIRNKIEKTVVVQNLNIEDKSFLHKKHKEYKEGKFHLKLTIQSKELTNLGKIVATKRIYGILDYELKNYIHSIQLLFI